MSSEDEFLRNLRSEARSLAYEAAPQTIARLMERVQQRIDRPPSPAEILSGWFRPLSAILAAGALALTLSFASWSSTESDSLIALAALTVSEELYLAY